MPEERKTGSAPLDGIPLEIRVELGRCRMRLADVMELREGSIVEMNRLPEDPVDVLVNGKPVARGEVVVVGDRLCVRITHLTGDDKATA